MRELRKPRDVDLPPVRLLIDDVEELVDLMTKGDPYLAVSLTTDRYELKDAKELEDPKIKANPPKELHINLGRAPGSITPLIRVDIRPLGVTLHAEEDDVLSSGILSKANDFLRSKRRRFSSYYENLILIFAMTMGIGILVFANSTAEVRLIFGGLAAVAFVGLIVLAGLSSSGRMQSKIEPSRREEQKPLTQNQLFIAMLSALSGAIALVIAEWLLGLLH